MSIHRGDNLPEPTPDEIAEADGHTCAYFGDGVYAVWDGYAIRLHANGLPGRGCTDTIHLETGMIVKMAEWIRNGFPDHLTGRRYGK